MRKYSTTSLLFASAVSALITHALYVTGWMR